MLDSSGAAPTKTCGRCHVIKPLENFTVNKNGSLRPNCVPCVKKDAERKQAARHKRRAKDELESEDDTAADVFADVPLEKFLENAAAGLQLPDLKLYARVDTSSIIPPEGDTKKKVEKVAQYIGEHIGLHWTYVPRILCLLYCTHCHPD
jgi:hypothetical protein